MSKQDEMKAAGGELFNDLPVPASVQAVAGVPEAATRIHEPNRGQLELRALDLDSLLAGIKARGAAPGRRATDPRVLIAPWLYATLEGVGSGARWPG
jgi:hypothetical protein